MCVDCLVLHYECSFTFLCVQSTIKMSQPTNVASKMMFVCPKELLHYFLYLTHYDTHTPF